MLHATAEPHSSTPPDSKGLPLPQVSQAVVSRLPVRGANHLDGEHGLQLPQLQQHDGQVVDEEQGIHQGHGVLHYPLVVGVLRVQDANAVEEPVGKHEEEYEDQQKGPKHKHPREVCLGLAEKKSPGADQEDEEFKRHRDEQSLTDSTTRLQIISPQDLG